MIFGVIDFSVWIVVREFWLVRWFIEIVLGLIWGLECVVKFEVVYFIKNFVFQSCVCCGLVVVVELLVGFDLFIDLIDGKCFVMQVFIEREQMWRWDWECLVGKLFFQIVSCNIGCEGNEWVVIVFRKFQYKVVWCFCIRVQVQLF